ncbi:LacI family DNA-binding transcriptional regulator [Cohnella rhizosphaerae]|uniref:LacI family transcriptional regulator n=1 Tax=Cohnella rhizosphaerae TaxID=1457232 RepID=A0A9X4KRA0_9BACL|nr:LacI family DNA-binding transcriptional regulator [Cohnella rhizosphaerae]MDG0809706.1 LacI family transcriptional regulator [Cohnella rhizosphaerae]
MEVIDAYHYVPNLSAQVLAGKGTRTIGLFVIEAGRVSGDMLTNLLLASVVEHASSRGYYVLTYIIRDTSDADSVRGVKDAFYQRRVDGGVFIGAANEEPFIEALIADGFPVGVVDQHLPGRSEGNRIVANFDNAYGMRLAVGYLAELGHREIGIVNGDMNRYSGVDKYNGFLVAMREHGLEVRERWVRPGSFHEEDGYRATRKLLEEERQLPTAMIMANDSVAFGGIRALQEAGMSVPEDMSVIGFDDHALSARFKPALTTVAIDFGEMMSRLTDYVIGRIEGTEGTESRYMSRSKLIKRESCRPIG